MVDSSALRVVVLGRSFYGLHGFGGLERHLYDLVRHHLAEGWRVTVVTRTPRDAAGVDPARWRVLVGPPGLRCPMRGLPHVPVRGPRWHDDSGPQHGLPLVRPSRRPPRSGPGRCRSGRHRLRRRRQRVGLRQSAARRRQPRRWCSILRASKSSAAWTARTAATRSRASATRHCARSSATAPRQAMRSSPRIRRLCPASCGTCPWVRSVST